MNQPIRILQLFTILNRGGAETNVMNYYRKLDKSKFQFDFVVHRQEEGAYEKEIIELGGKIFRFQNINPLHLNSYQKEIKDFFNNHHYQIIHGQCSELGYYFYKEAHKRQVPVIIAHAHNSRAPFDLKFPFRWYWKKQMSNYINAYFSCGDAASKWFFGEKMASKAFVMTNAIDSEKFAYNSLKSDSMRKELHADSTKNIIHIGRFNLQKNHEFLITIFSEILKKDATYKLFLVGEGELKHTIENKVNQLNISNNVVFLGSRNDVNELLQAMDIFIFPSLFEGLPVALVEAQASGVKCFISDGIPTEAILIPENVDVISLQKTTQEWADTILSNNQFVKKDVSQLIIDKGYDINKNVKILENKYLELLNRN